LLTRVVLTNIAQELKEPGVSRQAAFTHAAKHAQIRLEQRKETLRPLLVHVTPGGLFLGVIDELVDIALQGPIAAGRVHVQSTACLHSNVGRFLYRLHGEIAGRLDDDCALAADPGDDRGPVFVLMAPTGLTLLAATTRATPQVFLPSAFGLSLLASRVIEVIRFHRALHLALHLVGQDHLAEPLAPAIARPAVDAHFPGNAP
jgi:hypothetical protein